MRWLTLLLIVLNLALFGYYWQRQQAAQAWRSQQLALPSVPAWRLLSEVESGDGPVEVESNDGAMIAAPQAAVAPAEVDRVRVELALPVPAAAEAVAAAPAANCYRFGDFASRSGAEQLLAGWPLQASRIEALNDELEPDYWVYLEDPGGTARRDALRRGLSDMGFENYWIQRGPLTGRLSLGLYRNRDSAEALLHMLQSRGYPAKLHRKARYSTRYVVEIATQMPLEAVVERVRKQGAGEGAIKTEKKLCQGLASAELPE